MKSPQKKASTQSGLKRPSDSANRSSPIQALVKILLLLFTLTIYAEEDQLHILFGSSGYPLYKTLDFANDHGFRYVKILSYEFTAYDHTICGKCHTQPEGGRYFELTDDTAKIAFLCFTKRPVDPYIIDVEKYRPLLDSVAAQAEK